MMKTSAEFLEELEAFLAKYEIAPTSFGRLIMNDPTYVFQLREGRSPSLDNAARISRIINQPQAANLFGRPPPKKHER